MKKLANETQSRCRILGLNWLSACLEAGKRVDPKDYVLFDPVVAAAAAAKSKRTSAADGGTAGCAAGSVADFSFELGIDFLTKI